MGNTITGRLKLYDADRERALFVTIALVRDADGAGLVIRPDDASDLEATRLGDDPTVPMPPELVEAIVTALRAVDSSSPATGEPPLVFAMTTPPDATGPVTPHTSEPMTTMNRP